MNVEPAVAKLVLAGAMGAGKSTAIASLADAPPVSTEMPMTDGARGAKTTTTVALDFATALLDDGTPLFLYGMPGQDHLSFMRPIVLEGALGVLLMLDGRDPDLPDTCAGWIDSVHGFDATLPLAVGVTHTDLVSDFSLEPLRSLLSERALHVPAFTVDARDRAQMAQLARSLLASALD